VTEIGRGLLLSHAHWQVEWWTCRSSLREVEKLAEYGQDPPLELAGRFSG
jgi:hypothetical protein